MALGSLSKSTTQAVLRFVGNRNHLRRLPGATLGERAPDAGAVLIVPGGLDQEATDERVTRARNSAAPMPLSGGVFAGDQSDIGH